METRLLALPDAPVWVLEDKGAAAAGQAAAIAGRLGVPFRRIGSAGPSGQVRAGSRPQLIVSAGARSAAQSLLLRARHGCRVVHCVGSRPLLPRQVAGYPFDLMVLPAGDRDASGRMAMPSAALAAAAEAGRLVPVLGPPHVVSPGLLARARDLWADRLSHLPHPRLVAVLGGGQSDPAVAQTQVQALARRLSQIAQARRGCVLAAALAECPPALADAFSAGLSGCMHLIHRSGEPGDDPLLGFLGSADAVVAAWTGAQALAEACAASAPIFVVPAPGGRRIAWDRGLSARLARLDQVRPLEEGLSPWRRTPLDEAGRIAATIVARFARLGHRAE